MQKLGVKSQGFQVHTVDNKRIKTTQTITPCLKFEASSIFQIGHQHIRISITIETNKCKTIIKLSYIHNNNHQLNCIPMNN